MSNSMFLTGLSGLNAAQAALVTTGHNTANVNTAGYSRQTAQVASSGGIYAPGIGFFGTGAKTTDVTRSYDQYLTSQLNQAQSLNQSLTTHYTQVSQIDNLLANQTAGLAPQLQTLFTNVQAVANTPADPSARQQLISSGQAVTNQFRSMDQYLTGLNANVNDQISGTVDQINTYAEQIANLNKQVAMLSNATGGQAPNDLLDQRDQLINDLGKLVGTKLVVQDGGQYNVFIGNGQTLVLGDKATKLAAVSASSDPTRTTLATVNAAGDKVDVQESMISGGSLGGLLQFRNETLSNAQNSLGRIAIALSDTFNAQHKLGIDLNGDLGTDFFSQASPGVISNSRNTGATVLASFSDTSKLTISDYRVDVTAAASFTVTRLSDNTLISPDSKGAYDGVNLTLTGGAVGDSFLIQPTRTGARDLAVTLTDPAKVAAASPIITGNTAGNQGSGAISAGTVNAPDYSATSLPAAGVTLKYQSGTPNALSGFPAASAVTVTNPDATVVNYAAGAAVTYTAGAAYSFNGITVNISGAPANNDTFTIGKNTGGVSDGSNALLLGALQNKKTIGGSSASFNDAYGQLVSTIGNKARQIQISNTAQTSLTLQIRTAQQSVSGVNQDEETANLLMYQQMYQANAKVIQTASTMFDAVLGIRS
ncbi:MAG TPA: flagellar hook-associated protein FlgK [Polaromonas sp.]|uniref:flagellar hook-associated protein FlgK n=1 Tax=Polaromonas sp. UBA4122 TaxID=1947074 RepID=UPI000ED05BB5|nr:flagellar hook-associated protein FlgK [Polaromonas sp. UBA4122]HAL37256.1 flagellar hook-associated protein FlgK [Polaromonas sp.]